MDWSRAKTILIVLLFAVNIFLLGTYIIRENDERKEMEELRESTCEVLANAGISIKSEIVPLDSVKIKPATVRTNRNQEKIARALFGEVEEKSDMSETVYSGNGGNIMFRKDSFSFVYSSGKEINSNEDAKNLAYEIAKKLTLRTSLDDLIVYSTNGGFTVKIPQFSGNACVFDADIELNISSSGNVLGNGLFIANGSLGAANGEIMNISAMLFEFADEMKAMGKGTLNIVSMECGYCSKNYSDDAAYLTPAIKFITDSGIFYMSMSDAGLIKI